MCTITSLKGTVLELTYTVLNKSNLNVLHIVKRNKDLKNGDFQAIIRGDVEHVDDDHQTRSSISRMPTSTTCANSTSRVEDFSLKYAGDTLTQEEWQCISIPFYSKTEEKVIVCCSQLELRT